MLRFRRYASLDLRVGRRPHPRRAMVLTTDLDIYQPPATTINDAYDSIDLRRAGA